MIITFTIFGTKVTKEKRISFEITADSFYSESNMKYLEKLLQRLNQGKKNQWKSDKIKNSEKDKQHNKGYTKKGICEY